LFAKFGLQHAHPRKSARADWHPNGKGRLGVCR